MHLSVRGNGHDCPWHIRRGDLSAWLDLVRGLPLLAVGPDVEFVCKASARLRVQVPVRVGNLCAPNVSARVLDNLGKGKTHRLGIDLRIRLVKLPLLRSLDVDDAVDDGVHHVDALGPELARERLCERAHGEFARGEGGEGGASAHRRGRGREDQGRWVGGGGLFGGEQEREDGLGKVETT